jgi:hypothetical protein
VVQCAFATSHKKTRRINCSYACNKETKLDQAMLPQTTQYSEDLLVWRQKPNPLHLRVQSWGNQQEVQC